MARFKTVDDVVSAALKSALANMGQPFDLKTLVKPFDFRAHYAAGFQNIWWNNAPANVRGLRGKVELGDVFDLLRQEGLPLAPCPRSEILLEIMQSDGATSRREVIVRCSEEIVEDCDRVFARLHQSELAGEFARFASDGVAAFRAGAWASTQAMASVITTTVLDDLKPKFDEAWRAARNRKREGGFPDELDDAPQYEFWVLAPLWHAHEKADQGDLVDKWGRHSSVHKVSDVHYNVANAVISLMFVAVLLDFLGSGAKIT